MNQPLSDKLTIAYVLLTLLIILLHSTWNDNEFSVLRTITDLAVLESFFISFSILIASHCHFSYRASFFTRIFILYSIQI